MKSMKLNQEQNFNSLKGIVQLNSELRKMFIEQAIGMYHQMFTNLQGYTNDDITEINVSIDKIRDNKVLTAAEKEVMSNIKVVIPREVLLQTVKHYKLTLEHLEDDSERADPMNDSPDSDDWNQISQKRYEKCLNILPTTQQDLSLINQKKFSESIVRDKLHPNYARVTQWMQITGKIYKDKWIHIGKIDLTIQDAVSLFPYHCCEDSILDAMNTLMTLEMLDNDDMNPASFITSPAMAVFFAVDEKCRVNVFENLDEAIDIIIIPLLLTTFNPGHYNVVVVNTNPNVMTIQAFDPKQQDKIELDSLYSAELVYKLKVIRSVLEQYIGRTFKFDSNWPLEQPYIKMERVPVQEAGDVYSCGSLCIRFIEVFLSRPIHQKHLNIACEYRQAALASVNETIDNIFNFTEIDALRLRYFMDLDNYRENCFY